MIMQISASETKSFTEPAEYAAAMHGAKVELSVLAAKPFTADITYIRLNSVHIHRFSEVLPRIMHSAISSNRAVISFHTKPGPSLFRAGREVASDALVRAAPYQSCFQRSVGSLCWGTMSLPFEEMQRASITVGAYHLSSPHDDVIAIPPPSALEKFRRLHGAIGMLARDTPEVIALPEVAHGLEQALIQAMVTCCLGTTEFHADRAAQRHHRTIMRRFHRVLEAAPNKPLHVMEIAEAVGASVRSLTDCCQEHLGMGPKKFLVLRRMDFARQALSVADPSATSVTEVATQYGFWELGRFSVEYKSLFGESPSVTLRRERR
jgi:AraC-like DNA-binding protein